MKTLETYLRENFEKCRCEHMVVVTHTENGEVKFFICPPGTDGEFLDFTARGNLLLSAQSDDSHLEPGSNAYLERRYEACFEVIACTQGLTVEDSLAVLEQAREQILKHTLVPDLHGKPMSISFF